MPASTSTSSLLPPLTFPSPQHSMGDVLSLSATQVSQAFAESFDKDKNVEALDRIFGENVVLQHRYGLGRNAWQIKPNNLKLFELMVLSEVVHNFAPRYSLLDKNCYWYCNMVIDAIVVIFRLDDSISPGDDHRKTKFTPTNPHQLSISGHWNSFKVSHTKKEELSRIIYDFKRAHTAIMSEVSFFFF